MCSNWRPAKSDTAPVEHNAGPRSGSRPPHQPCAGFWDYHVAQGGRNSEPAVRRNSFILATGLLYEYPVKSKS